MYVCAVTGRWSASAEGVAVDAVRPRRFRAVAAALVLALLAALVTARAGVGASSFCTATSSGPTAIAAARKFVAECGRDYRITRGPYDADKATTQFANFAQVSEFTISVAHNSEGSLGFLIVGRRTRHQPWRTLEGLGSGP